VIQEINQSIINCKKKNKDIELIWIPAHKNILGNENADVLAKRAASEGPLLDIQIHSDIVNIFKSKYIKDNEDFLFHRAHVLNKDTNFFQLYHSQSNNP